MSDMPTISFDEYLAQPEENPCIALIDIETVPVPLRQDYWRRNDNVQAGRLLCDECDGTGNNFMYKHHTCDTCGGSGIDAHATRLQAEAVAEFAQRRHIEPSRAGDIDYH